MCNKHFIFHLFSVAKPFDSKTFGHKIIEIIHKLLTTPTAEYCLLLPFYLYLLFTNCLLLSKSRTLFPTVWIIPFTRTMMFPSQTAFVVDWLKISSGTNLGTPLTDDLPGK